MKTPDKYRFTLQWSAGTEEKIQAGDFLESLGNRKSEFIVLAVSEYLTAHPEALASGQKLKIVVKPGFTREQMEEMIRKILEERIAASPPAERESGEAGGKPALEPDIEEMLKNLEFFS